MTNSKQIFDKFTSNVGLYEQTYGKLIDPIVRDSDIEANKNVLKNIFGFTDVDKVFPKKLNIRNLEKQTKILFNYRENIDNLNE